MTQTGKCDICRQRKVKCDEEKPKCGACRKKDRPCSYTYGRASAFVVQDPNQLTKHGRSKVVPVVYSLDQGGESSGSSSSTPSQFQLRVSTQRRADVGSGTFQTLAPVSVAKVRPSRGIAVHMKMKLDAYLRNLQLEASLVLIRPSSAETILIARWVDMLGSAPADSRPLSILGTWIQSIPSRIGKSPVLDLAVEFLVDSYATYWDDSYSRRHTASTTKSRALREMQLAMSQSQTRNTYDMVLTTKMHYAAETLLGVDTMYHAIHAFGLAELLKTGGISNVDGEHYWNLIDNTYVDDVNEAMIAGRASVFDNELYLSMSYPPALASDLVELTPTRRASMSIMHCFVQCPRLNCLVREAIRHPKNSENLAAAVSLTEYMWQIDLPSHVSELLRSCITTVNQPSSLDMADILTESLHYDSVQSMILCTRYCMLQNILCGLTDTLHRHFPAETALSNLPDLESVRLVDSKAGICLAESRAWADSVSQTLPLVPLRLHTPLQISIGPWHRITRHLASHTLSDDRSNFDGEQQISETLSRATRMKKWVIEECNRIHRQWGVSTVDDKSLYEALDSMAGEEIPGWLPTRVRFESENGDMVIKLDYEKSSGNHQDCFALDDGGTNVADSQSASGKTQDPANNTQKLQDSPTNGFRSRVVDVRGAAIVQSATSLSPTPTNFIFKSGRNLCSTSGWWPTSDVPAVPENTTSESTLGPCTASSWWSQTPNA